MLRLMTWRVACTSQRSLPQKFTTLSHPERQSLLRTLLRCIHHPRAAPFG